MLRKEENDGELYQADMLYKEDVETMEFENTCTEGKAFDDWIKEFR